MRRFEKQKTKNPETNQGAVKSFQKNFSFVRLRHDKTEVLDLTGRNKKTARIICGVVGL